jgi:hypothetical protein
VVAQVGVFLAADIGDGEEALRPCRCPRPWRRSSRRRPPASCRLGGAGMAGDIGQRLLQDVEHLAFLFPSRRRSVSRLSNCRTMPVRSKSRRPGPAGRAARPIGSMRLRNCTSSSRRLAIGVVQRLADVAGVLGALPALVGSRPRAAWPCASSCRPGLRQRVVDLGGHHLPFAGQHDAQVLALQAGVFERHAEVLADRAEQQRDLLRQSKALGR